MQCTANTRWILKSGVLGELISEHELSLGTANSYFSWSDIYYIPRRYFTEFIELSNVFLAVPVFHEVAIPTILNIIDKTHERRPSKSIITRIGDCCKSQCY